MSSFAQHCVRKRVIYQDGEAFTHACAPDSRIDLSSTFQNRIKKPDAQRTKNRRRRSGVLRQGGSDDNNAFESSACVHNISNLKRKY
jgi:hypothetical protein